MNYVLCYNNTTRLICFISLFLLTSSRCNAQDSIGRTIRIPFNTIFYHIDKHTVGSFTKNYGLNYLLAAGLTYGIIKSGLDWKWYQTATENKWIGNTGFLSVSVGGLVPFAGPLAFYFYGRAKKKSDLQVTGLALGQAALLGIAISSSIKVFTGRVPPYDLTNKKDYSGNFRFGFFRGGAFDGWPSSHTTIAFAMATTLIELYPGNTAIQVGSLAYASLIGLGVSTNIHWFSDAVAGAFVGYAIGKTVGIGFKNLMNNMHSKQVYNFYATPTGAGVTCQF